MNEIEKIFYNSLEKYLRNKIVIINGEQYRIIKEDEEEYDEDDFDDEGMELYDVNFEEEMEENPFAIISVAVDKKKCPEFENRLKGILQTLGIPFSSFRKKESDEDE